MCTALAEASASAASAAACLPVLAASPLPAGVATALLLALPATVSADVPEVLPQAASSRVVSPARVRVRASWRTRMGGPPVMAPVAIRRGPSGLILSWRLSGSWGLPGQRRVVRTPGAQGAYGVGLHLRIPQDDGGRPRRIRPVPPRRPARPPPGRPRWPPCRAPPRAGEGWGAGVLLQRSAVRWIGPPAPVSRSPLPPQRP